MKLPILKLAKMFANLKGSSQEFYSWDYTYNTNTYIPQSNWCFLG